MSVSFCHIVPYPKPDHIHEEPRARVLCRSPGRFAAHCEPAPSECLVGGSPVDFEWAAGRLTVDLVSEIDAEIVVRWGSPSRSAG